MRRRENLPGRERGGEDLPTCGVGGDEMWGRDDGLPEVEEDPRGRPASGSRPPHFNWWRTWPPLRSSPF